MYELQLNSERSMLRDLDSRMDNVILKYQRELQSVQAEYNRVYGSAEEKIENLLASFESEAARLQKEAEEIIGKQEQSAVDGLDAVEKGVMDALERRKEKQILLFRQRIDDMILYEGEL